MPFFLFGAIVILCVGGIDLFQWKQGNTWFKSILKKISHWEIFFFGIIRKIQNTYLIPEKKIDAFFKNNGELHYKLIIWLVRLNVIKFFF